MKFLTVFVGSTRKYWIVFELEIHLFLVGSPNCNLDLSKDSFPSLDADYKFNNEFNNQGYELSGSFFGTLSLMETTFDGPDRGFGDVWEIGSYVRTENDKMIYEDGTHCWPTEKGRVTTIEWSCGSSFEITSMIEPSTCVYEIKATKPCLPGNNPPETKIPKFQRKFEEFRAKWLTEPFPEFSKNIQKRINNIGNRMVQYYEENIERYYCMEDEEDDELLR